jgi:predicted HTH transcriptional regulator
MNLLTLLQRHEGKTLEFKRDLSSPVNVLRTIVAFANSAGGVLLIGVEDESRNVKGVESPLDAQERLANIISTGIGPPLMPAIEILPWRDKTVIVIDVFPSYSRPHHLVADGAERGTFIRVGPSNRQADEPMREELRRTVRNESYDEQPVPALNSEAIDFRAASELFAPHRKLATADLESLHLVTKHQRRLVPTNGGILLFGVQREAVFPDAWIQVGRFAGTTRTGILDTREIHDYLANAIPLAVEFVQKHARRSLKIEGVHRQERWSIPLPAVREAITNAVVHADYSQRGAPVRVLVFDDRVEVENPGLLPFGLTIDDIQNGVSKLRNRVIGRVFKELGLIEQWGSGIRRMIDTCSESGLPAPEFQEIGTHFRVTFRLQGESPAVMDPVGRRILAAIQASSGLSTKQVAEAINLSPRSTRTRLKALVEKGLIVEVGSSSTDPKRVYLPVGRADRAAEAEEP